MFSSASKVFSMPTLYSSSFSLIELFIISVALLKPILILSLNDNSDLSNNIVICDINVSKLLSTIDSCLVISASMFSSIFSNVSLTLARHCVISETFFSKSLEDLLLALSIKSFKVLIFSRILASAAVLELEFSVDKFDISSFKLFKNSTTSLEPLE